MQSEVPVLDFAQMSVSKPVSTPVSTPVSYASASHDMGVAQKQPHFTNSDGKRRGPRQERLARKADKDYRSNARHDTRQVQGRYQGNRPTQGDQGDRRAQGYQGDRRQDREPLSQIELLQRRANSPKVDLYESDSQVFVRMELAGALEATVNLKESQILLVSFEKHETSMTEFTAKYTECKYGRVMRRVKLPTLVFYNKTYTLENGVFTITLDKKEQSQQNARVAALGTDTVTAPQENVKPEYVPIEFENGVNWADIE